MSANPIPSALPDDIEQFFDRRPAAARDGRLGAARGISFAEARVLIGRWLFDRQLDGAGSTDDNRRIR
jgi:hypothetical protein